MFENNFIHIVCFLVAGTAALAFHRVSTESDVRQLNVAFITDLHIGEGCYGDLSFESCKPVRTLTDAVNKINEIPEIDCVFATGDLTSSALIEEFEKVRELLNNLNVPFYPVLGNHDSYPYTKHSDGSFNQTEYAMGDQYFGNIFRDVLQNEYSNTNIANWTSELCYNADTSFNSWFHNYEVSFPNFSSNFKILALDWVARSDALPEPGVGPQAELHDFECGTIDWLVNQLEQYSADTKIFLAQHHPFIFDPTGTNGLKNFTFDKEQDARVQQVLMGGGMAQETTVDAYLDGRVNGNVTSGSVNPSSYIGVQSGHIHRWFDGYAFTNYTAISEDWLTFPQYETPAAKGWLLNEDFVSSIQIFTFVSGDHIDTTLKRVQGIWKTPHGEWTDRPAL